MYGVLRQVYIGVFYTMCLLQTFNYLIDNCKSNQNKKLNKNLDNNNPCSFFFSLHIAVLCWNLANFLLYILNDQVSNI